MGYYLGLKRNELSSHEKTWRKLTRYKIDLQKLLIFLYIKNNQLKNITENIVLKSNKNNKNKKYL